MAQADTGLGWSAEDNWLAYSNVQIGNISAQSQLLAIHPGESARDNQGYTWTNTSGVNLYPFYIGSAGGSYQVNVYSIYQNATYRVTRSDGGSRNSTTSTSRGGGIYAGGNPYNPSPDSRPAPSGWNSATNNSDAANQMGAVSALYKKNSGYAVCCIVNWKDTVTTRITPILISTVEDYTKFTVDGQTDYPYSYTSIQRYEGLTFYMTYIRQNDIDVSPGSGVQYIDLSSVLASTAEIFRGIMGPSYANVTVTAPPEPFDPYAPGGNSETGGGEGSFDNTSDVIDLSPIPTLSFASTGFTRIYNPTLQEINALANYLWTDTTFLDTVINHLKQLLENPMDAIISLSLLPCPIPNGSPENVKVMYVNTGVTMAPATTQFVDVDCGTFALQEYYGSALDYNPYTKVHCYLPYIGQVTLDADEVMGRTLQVKYRIDIVTGMCAVMILVDQTVMYQFSGHCAINMPINSADFSGYIAAAMTAGKMVAGVVAGATGNIPLAAELIGAPAPQSTTSERVKKETERNPQTGRQVTARTTTTTYNRTSTGASFGEMSRKAAANTVGAIMGSKVTVEHAGGFTGNSGYLAVRRPYLIIERPRMCNPEEYGKYNGHPSMIYMSLGECVGYTEVQSIQFNGISATNPEMAELSELLKSGVIF